MFTWFKCWWNKPKSPEWRIIQTPRAWEIQQWLYVGDGCDYDTVSAGYKTLAEAELALLVLKNPAIKYY